VVWAGQACPPRAPAAPPEIGPDAEATRTGMGCEISTGCGAMQATAKASDRQARHRIMASPPDGVTGCSIYARRGYAADIIPTSRDRSTSATVEG
jgi:hypothetical protein